MDWLSRIVAWLSDHEAAISAVAAILVIAGVVFAGFRWLVSRRSQPAPELTTKATVDEDALLALPTGPVVAVLPFENLSRDPDQEYFSDGLTDHIITALSRFKDLFVIARNSTFRYKGEAVDVRKLNKELGARYVLEGSVQRAGDTLRVTAQLLDAKDGTHLWAETYDRELSASSILEVQDEITEQVVGMIAKPLGVISHERFAEVEQKPTENLDAYECVLQFVAYGIGSRVPDKHATVRDGLERAVKAAPRYAEAWAALSFVYLDEYRFDLNPRPNSLTRALEAARRAVDLDPTSQRPRLALAGVYFFRGELDRFFAEAERALALNPNNPGALASLGVQLNLVDDARGAALIRKAMKLDPFHPSMYNLVIAIDHLQRGENEEALAAARKVDMPGYFPVQVRLAGIYAELGHEREARSAIEELLRLRPGFSTEELIEFSRKWNRPEDSIRRTVAALRKAGLPE
jgi:adenylate cyclase